MLAVFSSFAGRQFRRVKNRSGGSITALDSNVFRAGGQCRRANNRRDTANVAPGSVSSPSLVFSPLEGTVPPGEVTQATSPKLRFVKILLARSYFIILCGRLQWEINHGDSATAASPLKRFANVRFVPPARSMPPDGNTGLELPASPLTQFLRQH